jgi:hypothetical protein
MNRDAANLEVHATARLPGSVLLGADWAARRRRD